MPWCLGLNIWELILALKLKLIWNHANIFVGNCRAIKIVGIDLAHTHDERFVRSIKELSLKCLYPKPIIKRIESFNSCFEGLLEEVP